MSVVAPASSTVALLTPAGRGGVAVVSLAGADAVSVLARVFRVRKGRLPRETGTALPAESRIALGELVDARGVVDEVLVARCGAEAFELGCHGGPGVARRVIEALVAAGAREADRDRATADDSLAAEACEAGGQRADGRDPLAAEALELLPLASTELAARALATQAAGELSRAIRELVRGLRENAPGVDAALARLESTARFGRACSSPPAVALLGRPNAGKSTLFNALVGRERAIVSPEPGTTRDVLEELLSLEGLPVRLLDLAGVRESSDPLEQLGVDRGLARAAAADVRLAVLDLCDSARDLAAHDLAAHDRRDSAGDAARERHLTRTLAGAAIVVLAKRDLAPEAALETARRLGPRAVAVSARTGEGLDELVRAIVVACVGTRDLDAAARGPVLFTAAQARSVAEARAALARGEAPAAVATLEALVAGPPSRDPRSRA